MKSPFFDQATNFTFGLYSFKRIYNLSIVYLTKKGLIKSSYEPLALIKMSAEGDATSPRNSRRQKAIAAEIAFQVKIIGGKNLPPGLFPLKYNNKKKLSDGTVRKDPRHVDRQNYSKKRNVNEKEQNESASTSSETPSSIADLSLPSDSEFSESEHEM